MIHFDSIHFLRLPFSTAKRAKSRPVAVRDFSTLRGTFLTSASAPRLEELWTFGSWFGMQRAQIMVPITGLGRKLTNGLQYNQLYTILVHSLGEPPVHGVVVAQLWTTTTTQTQSLTILGRNTTTIAKQPFFSTRWKKAIIDTEILRQPQSVIY